MADLGQVPFGVLSVVVFVVAIVLTFFAYLWSSIWG
jgi:hypothetical protein